MKALKKVCSNIYLVFMLKRSKEYGIKKVFGIRGRALFLQLWTENMLMIVISLLLAWFFIEIFSGYASRLLGSDVPYTAFDWQLSLGVLVLLPLLTTVYPFIKYNYLPPIVSIRSIGSSRHSVATRTVFLFIQYSITLLLIVLSLYFSSHLRFLQNTPPGGGRYSLRSDTAAAAFLSAALPDRPSSRGFAPCLPRRASYLPPG